MASNMRRRGILRGLGGMAMVPTFLQSMTAAEAADDDTIVVCILLAGGNDGLNTVVPLNRYGAYQKLRTPSAPPPGLALAYTEADLAPMRFNSTWWTPASSATEYAFAPSMTAMRALYATGNLAVINGVGLPKAELNPLSHTNAQTDWLTGLVNAGSGATVGWLGTALQHATAGTLGPTASLGGETPLLNGPAINGLVLTSPIDNYGVSYGYSNDYDRLIKEYRRLRDQDAASATGTRDQAELAQAIQAVGQVHQIAHAQKAKGYPLASYLDYQLRDIGRLIAAQAGIRGFFAIQGSYDTHSAQAQYQPTLLAQLGQSIAQFHAYLQSVSASSNVVIMTMSDFGRRPFANEDFGTDHGGATTSFVFGDRVKGGAYGNYPSLSHFDLNGNLAMNVDFRNVLSDLIGAMGGAPAAILGERWPRLGFI